MIEIFSYWIFIWFIVFYLGLTKYNPLFLLLIGYIFTLFEFIYLIINKTSKYNLIKFFLINVLIKVIPILLIIKYPLRFNLDDIYVSIYLIISYLIIMSIMNKNPYEYYKLMINTYLYDDNKYKTTISLIYDNLFLIIINRWY
jgi:hypothetical protein